MVNLIQVKCDDSKVWMEVDEELKREKRPRKVGVSESIGKTIISFDKFSDTIRAYCTSLVSSFKGFRTENTPNKITVDFGLKLGGEGSVYVVKSAAEASIKISAEWNLK